MSDNQAKVILVVGRHAEIMRRVTGLLEPAGYGVVGVLTDDEAVDAMRSRSPDALLIGGGVEPAARQALKVAFGAHRPGRPVVEHSGGPSGLLDSVQRALR